MIKIRNEYYNKSDIRSIGNVFQGTIGLSFDVTVTVYKNNWRGRQIQSLKTITLIDYERDKLERERAEIIEQFLTTKP